MDDDEMGRPPRHERTAKASRGGFLGDVLSAGAKEVVRVHGSGACGCGHEVNVDFTGPSDSLGARVARGMLADPKCVECLSREDAEREAQAEADRRVEELRSRLASAGLPDRWSAATFDRLEPKPGQEEAFRLARRWAAGEEPGLLLHGEVGRGKTLIAAAATVERCALSGVRWLSVAKLLMDLRMPFESPEYVRAIRRLDPGSRGIALVLDDLDKLKPTEHALQPLYVAVNGWLEAGQPLLVTMNRDIDALAEWGGETFGAALGSRLAGYCEVVEVSGEDWRLSV
jgi:DNA replication protein DnaC